MYAKDDRLERISRDCPFCSLGDGVPLACGCREVELPAPELMAFQNFLESRRRSTTHEHRAFAKLHAFSEFRALQGPNFTPRVKSLHAILDK